VEEVPSSKPSDVCAVRSIKIDTQELEMDLERYAKVRGNQRLYKEVKWWKKEMAAVRTVYK